VDANEQLSITVQKQHVETPSGNYSLAQLLADNQTFGGLVIVTQPITVCLLYAPAPSTAPSPAIQESSNGSTPQTTSEGNVVAMILGYSLLARANIPLLSPMISFTAGLANFGSLLAAILAPRGPPIAGYVLGSLFIGFVYVLPVSALILFYRTAKTKQKPSLRTLAPLAIVWTLSLTLIIMSSNVAALQGLLATLQILLVITTMLLFPLVIAIRMAKLAA